MHAVHMQPVVVPATLPMALDTVVVKDPFRFVEVWVGVGDRKKIDQDNLCAGCTVPRLIGPLLHLLGGTKQCAWLGHPLEL